MNQFIWNGSAGRLDFGANLERLWFRRSFIRAELTISKSVFWSKWVVLSFLLNPEAQSDFILLRLEWKYKTRTFSLLESVIFTVEIESSQCLGECICKQVFFESETPSRRWGFSLAFPLPIPGKCNHFFLNLNFSLKVVKNKKSTTLNWRNN